MMKPRRTVLPRIVFVLLGATAAMTLPAALPIQDVLARPLTESERDRLRDYREERERRAEDKETWGTARATAKDVMFWALDQAIGKAFEPLEVVPASGGLIDKFKPTGAGLYRRFVEEPWVDEMYKKYTDILYAVKNKAFDQHQKTKAELDDVDALLDKIGDNDPEAKQLLEDKKRQLSRELEATDTFLDDIDDRLLSAEEAKDDFDAGGDIPAGLPTLLKNLNNEIKEMQDRRQREAAEPEEEIETSCRNLKDQQLEIEKQLYAEFQRRRSDPGMVLEAQRAQNKKLELEAQMAHCAD